MSWRAVIFDLDDTLIVENAVAGRSLRSEVELVPGADVDRGVEAVLEAARAPWRSGAVRRSLGGTWRFRRAAEGCVVCRSGRPFDLLGEHTCVTTEPEIAVSGCFCVVSKAGVVEPFELPEAESAGSWHDCMAVVQALADLFRPAKMNYEVHGNTLPHLHMHLLPRQTGDAFVGRSLNLKERHCAYSEADVGALKAMVARLSPGGAAGRAAAEP